MCVCVCACGFEWVEEHVRVKNKARTNEMEAADSFHTEKHIMYMRIHKNTHCSSVHKRTQRIGVFILLVSIAHQQFYIHAKMNISSKLYNYQFVWFRLINFKWCLGKLSVIRVNLANDWIIHEILCFVFCCIDCIYNHYHHIK